jgi:hypothetical protein
MMKNTAVYPVALLFAILLSAATAHDDCCLHLFKLPVEVIPNFLTFPNFLINQNNEAPSYSVVEEFATTFCNGQLRGKANLLRSLLRALQELFSLPQASDKDNVNGCISLCKDAPNDVSCKHQEIVIKTIFLNKTTEKHINSYVADGHHLEHGKCLAFVFLNNNTDAYFVHGDVLFLLLRDT